MNKSLSICMNLDTLSLASGGILKPESDPTYRLVDERLVSRVEDRGMRVTFFAVGQDLLSRENRRLLRKWSAAGHEIGNHSYSHPLNLAALSRREIEREIEKADKVIKQITGEKPRAFNAPGWAMSAVIDRVLLDLGYKIDYSPFPSWWIYPLLLKQRSLGVRPEAESVWGKRESWLQGSLLKLPLPTVGILRLPVWHTGWFTFGERVFEVLLKTTLKIYAHFYYLLHPADILDTNDLPRVAKRFVHLERLSITRERKMRVLDKTLSWLGSSTPVTAKELSREIRRSS